MTSFQYQSSGLYQQIITSCRHLLSEQNRDPYQTSYGCFDRRYWAWKLVDYPEATFQRNVYPLAWLTQHLTQPDTGMTPVILTEAVQAGLMFAARAQHQNGSFDQAFPYEQSFGATAFLIHPLLKAFQIVQSSFDSVGAQVIVDCLQKACNFLCQHNEDHGHIANHLAGAVLSLLTAAQFLNEPRYRHRALDLLSNILAHQSSEGWFLEYEGADPGYQTLCLYYLAQVYCLHPDESLGNALGRAIKFLAWFIHPDGSFGGEYGSRRTSIYYPGGIALLSEEFPLAQAMTAFMLESILNGHTITLQDIDIANMAPLLSNYLLFFEAEGLSSNEFLPELPCQHKITFQDFSEAGLHIRGTQHYYAVVGLNTGGSLKVFNQTQKRLVFNDSGYVGQIKPNTFITSQITALPSRKLVQDDDIQLEVPFYEMPTVMPTPFRFIILRLLNLTLMRNIKIGNFVKRFLVNLLITQKRPIPLKLERQIKFESEKIEIVDKLTLEGNLALSYLECGRLFIGIHMASARYFQGLGDPIQASKPIQIDIQHLNEYQTIENHRQILL